MQDQRSLLAQFLRFSSATVASLMVFSLYSIVDGLFVAKGVGDYAMAAVNLAVPFTNVMFSIAVTFAVACVVALIVTPIVRGVAHRYSWLDQPEERKVQTGKVVFSDVHEDAKK